MATQSTAVKDVMARDPAYVRDHDSLQHAAEMMANRDIGVLPICDNTGHLQGILTDRDIVVRAVAQGRDPSRTPVKDVESDRPMGVHPEETLERAASMMEEHRVRRIPVVEDGRLVGIVSQADIARNLPHDRTGHVVSKISR
jgi:CBS domain-containing protein